MYFTCCNENSKRVNLLCSNFKIFYSRLAHAKKVIVFFLDLGKIIKIGHKCLHVSYICIILFQSVIF